MYKPYMHIFHFVMDRGMKKDLKKLDIYEETESLSGVIVKIFSLLAPLIKKEHKWGEQRMSRYLPVCDDPDKIREHVHVCFPGEIYRQLKLIHQDLNAYSIAQLLREFLRFFLALVKEYGNNVFNKLKRIFKQWKEEDGRIRLTHSEIVQQLLLIIQHFLGKNKLINIYDRQSFYYRIHQMMDKTNQFHRNLKYCTPKTYHSHLTLSMVCMLTLTTEPESIIFLTE